MRSNATPAALLLAASLLFVSCGGAPMRLSLDPEIGAGPKALSGTARQWHGALRVHAKDGRAEIVFYRYSLNLEERPVLELVLRQTGLSPSRLSGEVRCTRLRTGPHGEKTEGIAKKPFRRIALSAERDRLLRIDLAEGATPVPDAFDGPVRRLAVSFNGFDGDLLIKKATLQSRSPASLLSVFGRNWYVPLLLLAPLLLWLLFRHGRLRPTIIGFVLILWSLEGLTQVILQTARLQASDGSRLSLREAAFLRHPNTLPWLMALGRAIPQDAEVGFPKSAPDEILSLARFFLFPRKLLVGSRRTPYLFAFDEAELPWVGQLGRGARHRITAQEPIGELYQVPPQLKYVMALRIFPISGTLGPGEELVVDLYATGRARKVRGRARCGRTGLVRFRPPVALVPRETYFSIRHNGAGDGRAALFYAKGDPYPEGDLVSKFAKRGDDLAFQLYFAPEGYRPVAYKGSSACLLARDEP